MKSRGLFLVLALAIPIWGAGVLLAPSAMCGPEDKKGGQGGGEAEKKKAKEERAIRRTLRMQEIEIHGETWRSRRPCLSFRGRLSSTAGRIKKRTTRTNASIR